MIVQVWLAVLQILAANTQIAKSGTGKMQLTIIILLLCIVLQQVKAFPRGGRGGGGRGGGGRGGGGRGGWFRGGGRGGGGGGRGVYLGPSPPPSWPTWRTLPGRWTYTTASDFTSGSSSWRWVTRADICQACHELGLLWKAQVVVLPLFKHSTLNINVNTLSNAFQCSIINYKC